MAIEAVIVDWGGTLTRWHDVDFHAESGEPDASVTSVAETPDVRTLDKR
jgi:putative hydrolase of the HAD superfamily